LPGSAIIFVVFTSPISANPIAMRSGRMRKRKPSSSHTSVTSDLPPFGWNRSWMAGSLSESVAMYACASATIASTPWATSGKTGMRPALRAASRAALMALFVQPMGMPPRSPGWSFGSITSSCRLLFSSSRACASVPIDCASVLERAGRFGFSHESNQAARGHCSIIVCSSDALHAGIARYVSIETPS
jgi:hypothetical protein